jgi:D-alanyl-D-alanine carboxypeptidase
MTKPATTFLNQLTEKYFRKKNIPSAVLCVESGDGSFTWCGATGAMQTESRYFIASVTKMYITAVVMQLVNQNKMSLDDSLARWLPEDFMKGLHVLRGVDYSNQLTIKHLISNTSGIPDYFFHKQPNGKTAADALLEGHDESWPVEKTIGVVKKLKPDFAPGKKAAYSDTNYQLLGRIIETVTGKTMHQVFKEYIFDPLGLRNTYTYQDKNDTSPVPFSYKSKQLWLPNYITGIAPEGGIVSTAAENMIFLKAFFNGKFFPKEQIEQMKQWKLILPPPGLFFYGTGLERIPTPWFISPFKPIKEILGFWGQTGSFAWYNPDTDLYFCGTTNQIDGTGHRAATNVMLKIIKRGLI